MKALQEAFSAYYVKKGIRAATCRGNNQVSFGHMVFQVYDNDKAATIMVENEVLLEKTI